MSDFAKFEKEFKIYEHRHPDEEWADHNIITYFTEIILSKQNNHPIELGTEFC